MNAQHTHTHIHRVYLTVVKLEIKGQGFRFEGSQRAVFKIFLSVIINEGSFVCHAGYTNSDTSAQTSA